MSKRLSAVSMNGKVAQRLLTVLAVPIMAGTALSLSPVASASAAIQGAVYSVADRGGVRPLSGWTVYLYSVTSSGLKFTTHQTQTAENGVYSFPVIEMVGNIATMRVKAVAMTSGNFCQGAFSPDIPIYNGGFITDERVTTISGPYGWGSCQA